MVLVHGGTAVVFGGGLPNSLRQVAVLTQHLALGQLGVASIR
jgi:hypothetical protein